jgi:hypothetical protein
MASDFGKGELAMVEDTRAKLVRKLGVLRACYGECLIESNRKPHRVFVCGPARSGTTLVSALVAEFDGFNPISAEAAPIRFVLEAYHRLYSFHNVHPGTWFNSRQDINGCVRSAVERLLLCLSDNAGSSSVVFKEPALSNTSLR